MESGDKALIAPDGKWLPQPSQDDVHEYIRKRAGYKSDDEFYKAGGIRLGVSYGGSWGYAQFRSLDEAVVRRVLKVLEQFPTERVEVDFLGLGQSSTLEERGRLTLSESGSFKEVQGKIRRWYLKKTGIEL